MTAASTAIPSGDSWDGRAEAFALSPEVRALVEQTIATRRELHANAEPSWHEGWTAGAIEQRLKSWGYAEVLTYAETGRAAFVKGGKPGPTVLYRTDIDGLPLREETGLAFASHAESGMHACGHDGHMAIALALAQICQQRREDMAGSVYFVFQPAEEVVGGAEAMLKDGVLDNVDPVMALGLHLVSEQHPATANVVHGAQMAAAAMFTLEITGKGGHGGAPHRTIDAVVVAAHVVNALQTIVARNIDPLQPAVVSIGKLHAGVKNNIIAEHALLEGTVRTFDLPLLRWTLERMQTVIAGVCDALGASYSFKSEIATPAVVNDARVSTIVEQQAEELLGRSRIMALPTSMSDDMAVFLEQVPGCYYLFGAAHQQAEKVFPHHHTRFDIDDRVLPLAVELGWRVINEVQRRGGLE